MGGREQVNNGIVVAVCRSKEHQFSKQPQQYIQLLEGIGVEGDAHQGVTVQHRSRVAADPTQPNLRQVHLIHAELLDELRGKGFVVNPGEIGENITTQGIDILALPAKTRLYLGTNAVVEITGLRNPCVQLDNFQSGLMSALLGRSPNGDLIRKAGVMGVVLVGGEVKIGDNIRVELPPAPYRKLEKV